MALSLSSAFKDTCENIKGIFDSHVLEVDKPSSHSKTEKVDKSHGFQLKNFWINLRMPVTAICSEVTKLSVLMSKQPLPTVKEIQDVLATIETLVLQLVTLSKTLPASQGYWLRVQFKHSIIALKGSLIQLFSHMQQENSIQNQLTWTGCVLDTCQGIIELPKDNLQTVLKILEEEESLLVDSAQEIEDEVKADEVAQVDEELDNSAIWTNQDKELLPPCVGLVHTARATLKRIKKVLKEQGKCDTVEHIAQLDAIADAAHLLNPAVDEFVCAIYPPMSKSTVSATALAVVTAVRQTLEQCQKSHWVGENDKSWLSFLLRAVDHNNNKVQPLLNPL